MSAQRYGTDDFWTGEREHLVLSGCSPAVPWSPLSPGVAARASAPRLGPCPLVPEVAAGSPRLPLGLRVLILSEGLFLRGTSVATSQVLLFLKQTV